MAADEQLEQALRRLDGVSLAELDERASLLRRIDTKYLLARDRFLELIERLSAGHQVLDIDGRRAFTYRSVYFDTPELRCFDDHVADRLPRFKARTRLYADSDRCAFEVKLKLGEDRTDKRQIDYDPAKRREVTQDARDCVQSALADAGLEPPGALAESLETAFARVTLAARDGADRLTCDLEVTLSAPDGRAVAIGDGLVLVENKSESGGGPAARELEAMGIEQISLSKYRVGMALVGGASTAGPQPGSEHFS